MLMRRVSRKLTYPTKPRAIMALDKTTCSPVLEQGTKRRDSFEAMFVLSSKSKIISKVKWHYACWFLPFVSPPPPPPLLPFSQFLFPFFLFCYLLIIILPLRSFCEGARLEPREPKSVHRCLYRITEYPSSVVLLQERKPAGLFMFMTKSG